MHSPTVTWMPKLGASTSSQQESTGFGERLAAERPFLLRIAQSFRRQLDPEDLVQETLTRALARRHLYQADSNLRAWLTTILRRLALDSIKRAYRGRELPLDDSDIAAPEVKTEPWWFTIDVEDVKAAGAQINASAYRVFELFHFDGLSYAAIAERLRIPKRTVGTRLFRARIALRQRLQESLEPPGEEP